MSSTATFCCASSSTCSTAATISILCAEPSASAATRSSSSASTKSSSIASSSSATRSRRSTWSTCSPASMSSSKDELTIFPAKALHHARRKAAARDRVDRGRARGAAAVFQAITASCSKRSGWRCATRYDLDMLREVGYCNGDRELLASSDRARSRLDAVVPARLLSERLAALRRRVARVAAAGARHVRRRPVAQRVLVEHGFRLPSALDNRPLTYDEFDEHINQVDLRFGDAGRVRNRGAARKSSR